MKKTIILLFAMLATAFAQAENVKTLTGHFTYYGMGNESRDACKRAALESARIDALEREYGRIITQDITSIGELRNGVENNFFQALNYAEIKGEYLGDAEEPMYKISLDDEGNYVVECTVKIKAKALSNEGVDFLANVMRNGMTKRDYSTEFRNGDDLFLEFQAPVNGYLAIYLAAEDGMVYTLFPYKGNPEGQSKIKANTHYVIFNPDDRSFGVPDCPYLTTDKPVEVNQLYIIFSPKEFIKAVDNTGDALTPNSLTFNEFNKWVIKNRNRDPKMSMKRVSITISN